MTLVPLQNNVYCHTTKTCEEQPRECKFKVLTCQQKMPQIQMWIQSTWRGTNSWMLSKLEITPLLRLDCLNVRWYRFDFNKSDVTEHIRYAYGQTLLILHQKPKVSSSKYKELVRNDLSCWVVLSPQSCRSPTSCFVTVVKLLFLWPRPDLMLADNLRTECNVHFHFCEITQQIKCKAVSMKF